MPGFMSGIHVLLTSAASKTWMAGTSPAMAAGDVCLMALPFGGNCANP